MRNTSKFLTAFTALIIGLGSTSAFADSYSKHKHKHGHAYGDDKQHGRYERQHGTHHVYRFNGNQPAYYYRTGQRQPVIFVPAQRSVVVSNAYSTPYPAIGPIVWW